VLPKGKLDDGETPRDAAEREVLEETDMTFPSTNFLGRWSMSPADDPRSFTTGVWKQWWADSDLMDDVKAVEWLPLDGAVERLSRDMSEHFSPMWSACLGGGRPFPVHRRPKQSRPSLEKRRAVRLLQPNLRLQRQYAGRAAECGIAGVSLDERSFVAMTSLKPDRPPVRRNTGWAMPFVEADSAVAAVQPELSNGEEVEAAQAGAQA